MIKQPPPPPGSPVPPPPPPVPLAEVVEETSLLRWSDLTQEGQAYIIQAWLSGPYTQVTHFCVFHGLSIPTLQAAFRDRGLTDMKRQLGASPQQEHLVSANQVAVDMDVEVKVALAQVLKRLLTEQLPLKDLLKIIGQLSGDRSKYGLQLVGAAQVAGPVTPSTSSTSAMNLLHPGLKQAVVRRMAMAGSAMVKAQEQGG